MDEHWNIVYVIILIPIIIFVSILIIMLVISKIIENVNNGNNTYNILSERNAYLPPYRSLENNQFLMPNINIDIDNSDTLIYSTDDEDLPPQYEDVIREDMFNSYNL